MSLSDVLTIHTYGKTSTIATSASAASVRARIETRRALTSCSGRIVDAASEHQPLGERERHDPDEEEHHRRRGLAELEVLKGLLVDVVHVDHRRGDRAALGHDLHDVDALEARDRQRDHEEQGGGREQRPRDVAEALPAARPVERRGLVEVAGNGLEPRDVEYHTG